MLEKVIAGGQSGADLAAWRAAKAAGIPTGGFMPHGFLTEDGQHPEYAALYGAEEHPSRDYPPRTEANVRAADVTLWFGRADSRGYWCTRNAANRHLKPFWEMTSKEPPEAVAGRLRAMRYKVANIAGNRESSSPGIGAAVERYLGEVFAVLKRDDDLAAIRKLHEERDEYAGEGY